jgi:hypothetical protein
MTLDRIVTSVIQHRRDAIVEEMGRPAHRLLADPQFQPRLLVRDLRSRRPPDRLGRACADPRGRAALCRPRGERVNEPPYFHDRYSSEYLADVAQLRCKLIDIDLIDQLVGFFSPRNLERRPGLVATRKCKSQLVGVDL